MGSVRTMIARARQQAKQLVPEPKHKYRRQPIEACMIAFPNSEKEEGILYVHFDEKEKVYLVNEAKIGACVWRTEKEAISFVKELLTEFEDGSELGFIIVPVASCIV
jgi:hypothetical protein